MIVNMTPHAINLHTADGVLQLAPSGVIPRAEQISTEVGQQDGVALKATSFGEVTGLPEQKPGVLLIVSGLIRTALPERGDLASPVDLVRDEDGRVVGAKALAVNITT